MLSANLGLGNDKLERVTAIRLVDRVVQDANRAEQVSDNSGLSGEVRWVRNDLLDLGGESHSVTGLILLLHRGADTGNLTVLIIHDLVDVGVEHVGATVDGRETGESLWELTKAVEGVDVRRLAITSHGVHVQTDTLDGLTSLSCLSDVVVGLVESHGVADKVASAVFKSKLVIDILHGAG